MSKSLEKKAFWKKLISIPLIVIALALIGYILLVAVYCIPTSKMEVQMKESCDVFGKEGSYISMMSSPNSKLDNFTDALMLLTASHPNTGNVWKDAVCASRLEKGGANTKNTLLYVFKDDGTDTYSISYARYWHGYLVFLKPLLLFFNYGQIRSLLMFLQLGLFLLVIVQMAEKNKKMVFPTFLVWIFLNPVANMLSLQFNSVITVMFCAMLFILKKQEKHNGEDIYCQYFLSLWEP